MPIQLKRAYEAPSPNDGTRVLVERLWPRGLRKEDAAIDFWSKGTAPSHELRKWFNHDPNRWDDFKRSYFRELDTNPEAVRKLLDRIEDGPATFIFASREEQFNNAGALKEYVEQAFGLP